jgi:hypothetical protein
MAPTTLIPGYFGMDMVYHDVKRTGYTTKNLTSKPVFYTGNALYMYLAGKGKVVPVLNELSTTP